MNRTTLGRGAGVETRATIDLGTHHGFVLSGRGCNSNKAVESLQLQYGNS